MFSTLSEKIKLIEACLTTMHQSSYGAFCQYKVPTTIKNLLSYSFIQATGELIGSDIYSFDYDEYDEEALIKSIEEEPSAELETPEFLSKRVDLVVTEEETIRLPCLLER